MKPIIRLSEMLRDVLDSKQKEYIQFLLEVLGDINWHEAFETLIKFCMGQKQTVDWLWEQKAALANRVEELERKLAKETSELKYYKDNDLQKANYICGLEAELYEIRRSTTTGSILANKDAMIATQKQTITDLQSQVDALKKNYANIAFYTESLLASIQNNKNEENDRPEKDKESGCITVRP